MPARPAIAGAVLAALAVLGCDRERGGGGDCAAAAAELEPWLAAVMSNGGVKPPWPTGDAAFDAELPALREQVRAARDPARSEKATELSPTIEPGRLEEELASCKPALAQLEKVGQVPVADKERTFAGLAGAIAGCGCNVSIPRVKALIYLSWRGPD